MDRGFRAIVAKLDDAAAAGAPIGGGGAPGRRRPRSCGSSAGPSSAPSAGRPARSTARRSCEPPARSPGGPIVSAPDGRGSARSGHRRASPASARRPSGEKTMLDALVPAVDAARAAIDRTGRTVSPPWPRAADAAEAGATATIPMLATKGRASYLGERSIGHQDPGATSSALLAAGARRRGAGGA